ncbi:MAG: HEAT repeat domain-containing protein [Geopsychrobacter sp.]|nr:HEAT repeat domain-containing protein [Geopsychrobacter sp.]
MGLKKERKIDISPAEKSSRSSGRNFEGLSQQLQSATSSERRWAARDLAIYPDAVEPLLHALRSETEHPVAIAIFDSLRQIGGETVVNGLLPLLSVEDAFKRNAAIEVLQEMPEGVALHIIELLNDRDSDVRIFAIDILQQLAHPQTPEWLLSVLKDETHINVIATAVDRLAEVGTQEMIPELKALKLRFPNEPYLDFAVQTAIRRIKGD